MIKMIISLVDIRDCLINYMFSPLLLKFGFIFVCLIVYVCAGARRRGWRPDPESRENDLSPTQSSPTHHSVITESSPSHHSVITQTSPCHPLVSRGWVESLSQTLPQFCCLPTWLQWSDVTFVCWRSFIVTRDKNCFECLGDLHSREIFSKEENKNMVTRTNQSDFEMCEVNDGWFTLN